MFNEVGCFYVCPHGDLTNSIHRQYLPSYRRLEPLWRRADTRFFWNYHLLSDLINSEVRSHSPATAPHLFAIHEINDVLYCTTDARV
jgi:hypothetical protein